MATHSTLTLINAVALVMTTSAAFSADAPARKAEPAPAAITWFDVAFSARAVTDYNFRGISQTDR